MPKTKTKTIKEAVRIRKYNKRYYQEHKEEIKEQVTKFIKILAMSVESWICMREKCVNR